MLIHMNFAKPRRASSFFYLIIVFGFVFIFTWYFDPLFIHHTACFKVWFKPTHLFSTGKIRRCFITHNSTSSANYYDSYVIPKRRKLYKIFLCKHPACVISRRYLKRCHYSYVAVNIVN